MLGEKNRFRLFIGIVASVIVIGVLFVVGATNSEGTDNWALIATAVIVGSIAVAASLVARKRLKEMKRGFPSEDEMSTAVKTRAGYLSFFVSMYLCLAIGWIYGVFLEDKKIEFPTVGELMFILVAVMGITYMVIWTAISRGKGAP